MLQGTKLVLSREHGGMWQRDEARGASVERLHTPYARRLDVPAEPAEVLAGHPDEHALAMYALVVTTADICGADEPYMTLEVTSPAGTTTLRDSFYARQGNGTYVDNLGVVLAALREAQE